MRRLLLTVIVGVSATCLPVWQAVADINKVPAKKLFGFAIKPAPLPAEAIGFYSKGCLAGGVQLPKNGSAWQAMRLSRNRHWGHPRMVEYIKRLAIDAKAAGDWPGLLVGDLAQPRGGPMLTGHRSHQIGLDADIWLTPMPKRRLSYFERETIAATTMLGGKIKVNPRVWSDKQFRLLRRAASYPEVERIFVHPAIKKALCDGASKTEDRSWLRRIRPYWGHHFHFHVRIRCTTANCRNQNPPAAGDGCGKEIKYWFDLMTKPARPAKKKPKKIVKPKPRRQITLASLPHACRQVLTSGGSGLLKTTAPLHSGLATPERSPFRKD